MLVVALSFGIHLGLIWLAARGGFVLRPEAASVIEVALVGGGAAPPVPRQVAQAEPREAKRVERREKAKPPPSAKKSRSKKPADVILPGKPTPSPSPRPTATPSPKPTAQPTAKPTPKRTPKPTPAPTAAPTAKPTVKPTAKPTAAPAKVRAVEAPSAKAATAEKKPAAGAPEKASAESPAAARKATKPSGSDRKAQTKTTEEEAQQPERGAAMDAALERARALAAGGDSEGGAGFGGTGAGSGAGGGSGSGVGAPMDPEFAAYYGLMLGRIREAWVWTGRRPDLKVTVGFRVGSDGVLSGLRVVERSGDRTYDSSVLRALRGASPLPPPPAAYRRDFSDVELIFQPADLEG